MDASIAARAVVSLRLQLKQLDAAGEVEPGLWRALTETQREAEHFYLALHEHIKGLAMEGLQK